MLQSPRPEIIQDGIKIPRFPNAALQLGYATSGFTDKKRKSAAFRAVAALFPKDRPQCGHAALGLSYLHLEPDYRFAKPIEIRQAVNDFKSVIKAFPEQDHVQARAHWYLGWIFTTLDNAPDAGRKHFSTIVRDYPDTPMNLAPPEPWVNLAHPQEFPQIKNQVPVRYWAQAALLELVRHPGSAGDALGAFNQLYDRFYPSMETGVAFKLMLSRPDLAPLVHDRAAAWATVNGANPYLSREILNLAAGGRP